MNLKKLDPRDLSEQDKVYYTTGMFGEEVQMLVFEKSDTREKYFEVVQAEPWSSGMCIFTHLLCPDGHFEGSWTNEEISERT
jgi:hypothetical protein